MSTVKLSGLNSAAMTPRDQIQEHAKIAGAKIREALCEFNKATGVCAQVDVRYLAHAFTESGSEVGSITGVELRWEDGALG